MASLLHLPKVDGADFQGLKRIFEFVNDDGKQVYFNCGQAAATTLLLHHGRLEPKTTDAASLMRRVESVFPPDNLGGWMGTSRRRVMQICRAHGLPLRAIRGEPAFRDALSRGQPVIVMLGVPGQRVLGFEVPAGHWMVAAGFDHSHVHLTNWGPMTWDDFRLGWTGIVPRLIQMRLTGLIAAGNNALP